MKALTANIIINLLALVLLISLFFRVNTLTRDSHERQLFYLFLGSDLICCVIAPFSNEGLSFLGSFNAHFLHIVNTLLYLGDLIIGMVWTMLLSKYYDHQYDFDFLALPSIATIVTIHSNSAKFGQTQKGHPRDVLFYSLPSSLSLFPCSIISLRETG